MNKYKRAFNTIGDTITYYTICKDLGSLHSDNEIFDSMETLRELVDKADSFDWIPVSERLPEPPSEYQDLDNSPFDLYLVSINEGHSVIAFWDGKKFGDGMFTLDVKAWMPLPKPYEEKENDCYRNV